VNLSDLVLRHLILSQVSLFLYSAIFTRNLTSINTLTQT